MRDFGGSVIGFSLFVDREADISVVIIEDVPTMDEVVTLFDTGRYGLTAKAVWDFRRASLSAFTQELLIQVATMAREHGLKHGLPLAVAMVASKDEDLVLLRLYNEISLHGVKRLRPHRIFNRLSDAINWLNYSVGDKGPDGGMSGLI